MKALTAVSFLLFLVACVSAPRDDLNWQVEVALDLGVHIGGCAVGDLLPEQPGQEIVCVAGDHSMWLVWEGASGPESRRIAKFGGECIQVAVGDVDPDVPGLEILAVGVASGGEDDGGQGAAYLVSRAGDDWRTELVCTDTQLLHAAAAGPGVAWVAGYGGKIFRVTRAAAGWTAVAVASIDAPAKSAALTPEGVAVALADGRIIEIDDRADDPVVRTRDALDGGCARLAAQGAMRLVACDDGALRRLQPGRDAEVLHRESDKLRGAVFLAREGTDLVAATCGYEGWVRVIRGTAQGGYRTTSLLRDRAKFHHLAADVADAGRGLRLIAANYTGRLYIITMEPVAR